MPRPDHDRQYDAKKVLIHAVLQYVLVEDYSNTPEPEVGPKDEDGLSVVTWSDSAEAAAQFEDAAWFALNDAARKYVEALDSTVEDDE